MPRGRGGKADRHARFPLARVSAPHPSCERIPAGWGLARTRAPAGHPGARTARATDPVPRPSPAPRARGEGGRAGYQSPGRSARSALGAKALRAPGDTRAAVRLPGEAPEGWARARRHGWKGRGHGGGDTEEEVPQRKRKPHRAQRTRPDRRAADARAGSRTERRLREIRGAAGARATPGTPGYLRPERGARRSRKLWQAGPPRGRASRRARRRNRGRRRTFRHGPAPATAAQKGGGAAGTPAYLGPGRGPVGRGNSGKRVRRAGGPLDGPGAGIAAGGERFATARRRRLPRRRAAVRPALPDTSAPSSRVARAPALMPRFAARSARGRCRSNAGRRWRSGRRSSRHRPAHRGPKGCPEGPPAVRAPGAPRPSRYLPRETYRQPRPRCGTADRFDSRRGPDLRGHDRSVGDRPAPRCGTGGPWQAGEPADRGRTDPRRRPLGCGPNREGSLAGGARLRRPGPHLRAGTAARAWR